MKLKRLFTALALAAAPLALSTHANAAANPAAPAQHDASKTVALERLWLGSAWYPEQWPEEMWDRDLALMKAHGANVVRIGEFAWARMEPTEGNYDLGWMERAVRLAEKRGLKVVLCTPTNTPPAWLTSTYPDTLRVDSDGVRARHGGRRQFSISSSRYRELARDIVGQMAERFGDDPNVIGWQIDNEYTDESYDDEARAKWHAWLQQRFGTLDALNEAWTTSYWSQTYTDWEQVPFNADAGNPGWMLEVKHFITDEWIAFQKNQADVLRASIKPSMFVTTNLGGLGWANRFDRTAINRDLDLASWDNYVGTGHLEPFRNGATHDLVRGWKRQNFWVMEIQPGFVNWSPNNNILHPGETRAMAWQAVGHGSDAIVYWQWRNALNGQEQYHGALVGVDGEPLPIYQEVSQIGRDFAQSSEAVAGTEPVAAVAILHDYDSRWAIDWQRHNQQYDQIEVLLDTYRPLKKQLGAVDIVSPYETLDRYKLVFAPSLNVIPEALGEHLAGFVRGGGTLVLGPRAGMKDEFNRLATQRQPGPLVDELGGRVEQFYALDETIPVSGAAGSGTTEIWAEHLSTSAPDATVLLRYGEGNGWLEGEAAAIARPLGRGRIVYLGALLDDELMRSFVDERMQEAGVAPDFPVPEGVERMIRRGEGREVVILINHNAENQAVTLPSPMTDVLAGGSVARVELASQSVAVLMRPTEN